MTKVNSGSIADVDHDPATSVLSVKFQSGQTYHYEGVSADAAAKLIGAGVEGHSVGRHFMANVRGVYKVKK